MKPLIALSALFMLFLGLSGAEKRQDIEYGAAGGERLLLDASVPEGNGPFPIAILVHGGGWSGGDKAGSDKPGNGADITPWFGPLTGAKYVWFSINYRMAPQHRWPACFEDVQTAIRWVKAHARDFHGDPRRIALFGHSAGGHLVCLAATLMADDVRVQAVVGFAPVTDLEQDCKRRGGIGGSLQTMLNQRKELTAESLAVLRDVSPIDHVHAGMPPVLLVHGDADKTVPLQQSIAFEQKLRAAGDACDLIVRQGVPHSLVAGDKIDQSYQPKLIAWLDRNLSAAVMPPDAAVAADGTGDFKTIQAALNAIPKDNRERRIILIKDGVYHEKIRIDAACVTLRGQSREGTRIEFSQPANAPGARSDGIGVAVVNINGDDCVLENLTIQNTHGVLGVHAFAIYGRGDRTVIQDCNVLSQGNDTISLWRTGNGQFSEDATAHASPNGRYYHARLKVCGSVDFICPRGWCYMVDSEMTEVNPRTDAAMWHDGSRDPSMRFVMRRCRFDGPENFRLARHHHDAMFFFLDCTFASTLRDAAPYRVVYPLNGAEATDADRARNKELDATNKWGERAYFFNSHREGGDYSWMKDNLSTAPGAPKPEDITANWTFDGKWDPERRDAPTVKSVSAHDSQLTVVLSEPVSAKGTPKLRLPDGQIATYATGSGTDTLTFKGVTRWTATSGHRFDLIQGAIIATEAGAALRFAAEK